MHKPCNPTVAHPEPSRLAIRIGKCSVAAQVAFTLPPCEAPWPQHELGPSAFGSCVPEAGLADQMIFWWVQIAHHLISSDCISFHKFRLHIISQVQMAHHFPSFRGNSNM